MRSLNSISSEPRPMPKMAASKRSGSMSLVDINLRALQGSEPEPDDLSIVDLYQAARDENELLEFKNYELQFKIQELEQKQKKMLSVICSNVTSSGPADSTQITTLHRQPDEEAAPPTRISSLAVGPSAATCGRLEEEQSRQLADTNPLDESDSRSAGQQCAKRSAGDRAPDGADEDASLDGHQFGKGSPGAREATRQRRHANEWGALSSALGGGAVPSGQQSGAPPMAAGRCQAKVDQLEQKPQQSRLVGHENINNELRQQDDERPHDKYASQTPMAELRDVARKTNRRSREPQPATDRKPDQCERGAHLIEYNGSAPTQQEDRPASGELPTGGEPLQANSPLDGHAASNTADSSAAVSGQLLVAESIGYAPQPGDSQAEAMSKSLGANQAPVDRPARARIAVPVQRRLPAAHQSSSQKNAKATSASNQANRSSIGGQRAAGHMSAGLRSLADPLRSRSKSSLEQKSVNRAMERQPQWQRPASLGRATSTRRVWSGQQSAIDRAPTVGLSRAASSGQLSAGRRQQQSASSFVTHIPTLIGASHAPAGTKTPSLSTSGASSSAMMRRIMRSRRAPTANQLADSGAKSKSLNILVPASEHGGDLKSADHVTTGRPTSMHGDGRVRVQPASLVSSESSRSMGELATDARRPAEAPISECFKCESQRNKVDKLMKEHEQLREQISELEELENDSRLMSQNLAQQLLAVEKKLDRSKLELQRATESESKLRFQNKRLQFELRQRQDCVGQLEHQMNELCSRARTLLRLQRADSAGSRKQLVAASQLNEASQKSDSLDCSKSAGSSSAEDSDSAIDELEKRLSLQSVAGSSASEARGSRDKPLVNVSYDSAYSKSSSSSDANSSTNSEADCTEHCAQSSACAASSAEELDSNQSRAEWPSGKQHAKPAECGDTCEQSAGAAGSASVEHERAHSTEGKQQATGESTLSPSDRPDKCATASRPAQQALESGCLSKNTEPDATSDCVSHQTAHRAGAERQSVPLSRISTPARELTDKEKEAANGRRSSIELALEGVDELEQARDRELEQFLAGQRETLPIRVAFVRGDQQAGYEGEKVTENGIGVAADESATPTRSLLDNEQQRRSPSSAGQLGELIDGLKHEVSSLKMRLVQANTLNDNLIRELKAQSSSPPSGCKGQLEPEGRRRSLSLELPAQRPATTINCLVRLNNLPQSNGGATEAGARRSWDHQAPLMAQAAGQPDAAPLLAKARRRSSVIYVNGLSASVTHHHHHYDPLQQQTKAGQPDGKQSPQQQQTQQPATPAACINCCFHRHQTSDRYLVANLQRQQLVEWLRFLLDKLHFHHSRTFELVSECQKFAMNALLASYNRQVGFLHHQRVVTAGNQAIRRAAAGEQQLQQQHVATGRVVIENFTPTPPTMGNTSSGLYPVQPPPRQRTASANRLLDQNARDETDALAPLHTAASVTALQVAEQTLSSSVPIYYSCNKQLQQQQPLLQANNQKQTLPLELNGRASRSADPFASDSSNQAAHLVSKAADIYATVNKADKRRSLVAGVSILEISNIEQKQQDLKGSHLSTAHGANVVSIEPTNRQKVQISSESSGHQFGPTTGPTSGVFKSINQQQLQLEGVRNSLSEDMERFRVHSNGQLLDLLMRQNWCESVISEKIKSIELDPRHA